MADIEYVKNYREKELRQYVLAYLLITIASVGFQTIAELQVSGINTNALPLIFQMLMTNIFIGAICILVMLVNEIWSDSLKTKLVYGKLPSDTIFSRISNGEIDTTGFDLDKAKSIYAHLFSAPPAKQTVEWNNLLRKCKDSKNSSVIEAERMQLMTRDICLSTISLLIMNFIAVIVFAVIKRNICTPIGMFAVPIVYLSIMLIVTKITSRNRANRFLMLVIKSDVQNNIDQNGGRLFLG